MRDISHNVYLYYSYYLKEVNYLVPSLEDHSYCIKISNKQFSKFSSLARNF